MLCTVFVYGTLMPGHLRWGLIASSAASSRPAAVEGCAYDTGLGWPAARFRAPLDAVARTDVALGPDAVVHGWLVALAPSTVTALLRELDEVEGAVADDAGIHADVEVRGGAVTRPPAAYRRVRVRSLDGAEAWAYEAMVVDAAWSSLPERWDRAER